MIKKGTYIVYWNNRDYLKSVYGCVIDCKEIDESETEYTLRKRDGNTVKISHNTNDYRNSISSYVSYDTELRVIASRWINSIEYTRRFLKEFLGDEFGKVGEIVENCVERNKPFKNGDEVIVCPIIDKFWLSAKNYQTGKIDEVSRLHPYDWGYEDYRKKNKLDRPCDKLVYRVKLSDGCTLSFTGIDFGYNGWFIGTREEVVSLMIKLTNRLFEELEEIKAIRKKLYDEVKDTLDNIECICMEEELDIPEPIYKSSQK